MRITEKDIQEAQVCAITGWSKMLVWGKAPFPQNYTPILAVTNISSPAFGILFRAANSGIFVLGTVGALKTFNKEYALTLIKKAKIDDTWGNDSWGGVRDGAGRPKSVPEDAKRRSIYMTDAEFEYVKKWLSESRSAN